MNENNQLDWIVTELSELRETRRLQWELIQYYKDEHTALKKQVGKLRQDYRTLKSRVICLEREP